LSSRVISVSNLVQKVRGDLQGSKHKMKVVQQDGRTEEDRKTEDRKKGRR